jgi:hypothetical protein
MIAFMARETEQAFFKDRILAIPQCEGKTDHLVAIANACQSILIPPVCA